MQIFNADETGVPVVHRPGKVIAELGHHNVYTITSAERGKTHTVLSCVSASALALSPCLIFEKGRFLIILGKALFLELSSVILRVAG